MYNIILILDVYNNLIFIYIDCKVITTISLVNIRHHT